MAGKTIIEADIDPQGNLDKYVAKFEKFKEALQDTPGIWADAAGEADAMNSSFQQGVAASLAMLELSKQIYAEETKRKKAADDAAKAAKEAEFSWSKAATWSRNFAGNIIDATASIAKWVGIGGAVSGLVGAGGLWGLTDLAGNVGEQRRRAQGLGLSIGERGAFEVDFARLGDPDAILSGVNQALTDPSKRAYLYNAGLHSGDIEGKNTAQVSVELLKSVKALVDKTPDSMVGGLVNWYGLGNLGLDTEYLRTLKSAKPGDLPAWAKNFNTDQKTFDIDDPTAKNFQDLDRVLHGAKKGIEAALINGLAPFAGEDGPIARLSKAAEKAIESLLGSDGFKAGLKTFTDWLGGPNFKGDVKAFIDDIGEIAKAVVKAAEWINGSIAPNKKPDPKKSTELEREDWNDDHPDNPVGNVLPPLLGSYDMNAKPNNLLDLVKSLELSGDSSVSPKGAIGRFQIMPDTGRLYGVTNSGDLFKPAVNEAIAKKVLTDLFKTYGGNLDEILVGYNASSAVRDRFRRSGDNWDVLPHETRAYLEHANRLLGLPARVNLHLKVTVPPGTNPNVTASQLRQ